MWYITLPYDQNKFVMCWSWFLRMTGKDIVSFSTELDLHVKDVDHVIFSHDCYVV